MAINEVLHPPPIRHYWTADEYLRFEAQSEGKHKHIDGVIYDWDTHEPHIWTVEEYLAYELESEFKHEYLDGEIYDMPGSTSNHNELEMNIAVGIGMQIRDSEFSLRSSSMRVKIREGVYVYPDLCAVRGRGSYEDGTRTLLNPILAVEVISPTSANYDRSTKLVYYQSLHSLQAYLIVDQNRIFAEAYTRTEPGWQHEEFAAIEETIPLPILNCSLPLSEIYRGIVFSED